MGFDTSCTSFPAVYRYLWTFPLSMNNGSDEVYSSQRDIYLQLINDLNEATTLIALTHILRRNERRWRPTTLSIRVISINGVSLLIRSNCVLLLRISSVEPVNGTLFWLNKR